MHFAMPPIAALKVEKLLPTSDAPIAAPAMMTISNGAALMIGAIFPPAAI
jgi:hypothetical protein